MRDFASEHRPRRQRSHVRIVSIRISHRQSADIIDQKQAHVRLQRQPKATPDMSSPSLQLSKTVPELLRGRPEQRLKAREIAVLIFERYPEACAAKKAKSPALETDADLIQQIVAEIGSQRKVIQDRFPQVRVTESRPRQFYWSEKSLELEVIDAEHTPSSTQIPGHNHPALKLWILGCLSMSFIPCSENISRRSSLLMPCASTSVVHQTSVE